MRHLMRYEAKQFWKKDLNIDNCGTYYAHALMLHDGKVKDVQSQKNALPQLHTSLTDDSDACIVRMSDLNLWIQVVSTCGKSRNWFEGIRLLSFLVATFCEGCGNLTSEEFIKMVNLPWIHHDAAFKLLTPEPAVIAQSDPDPELSNLQESRIVSLAEESTSVEFCTDETLEFFIRQPPISLTLLLVESWRRLYR